MRRERWLELTVVGQRGRCNVAAARALQSPMRWVMRLVPWCLNLGLALALGGCAGNLDRWGARLRASEQQFKAANWLGASEPVREELRDPAMTDPLYATIPPQLYLLLLNYITQYPGADTYSKEAESVYEYARSVASRAETSQRKYYLDQLESTAKYVRNDRRFVSGRTFSEDYMRGQLRTTSGVPEGPIHAIMERYHQQVRIDDWQGALAAIREAVRAPATSDPRFQNLPELHLRTLARVIRSSGFEPAFDAEARPVLDKAEKMSAPPDLGLLEAVVEYHLSADRPGAALPIVERVRAMPIPGPSSGRLKWDGYYAQILLKMGEVDLQHAVMDRVLREIDRWIVVDKGGEIDVAKTLERTAAGAHLVYLVEALSGLAYRGDQARMEAIWARLRQVAPYAELYPSLSFGRAAVAFAIAGDRQRAHAILAEAATRLDYVRTLAGPMASRLLEALDCDRADVLTRLGDPDGAGPPLARCAEGVRARSGVLTTERLVTLALHAERSGDHAGASVWFGRAAEGLERDRGSFPLSDRVSFFRSPLAREVFSGLVRTAARKAVSSRRQEDVFAALAAAERLRARQLGDALGAEAATVDAAGVERYGRTLPPDTAVLSYTTTDGTVVIIGFDRARHVVQMPPKSGAAVDREIREAVAALADPRTPVEAVEGRLLALSRTFVTPVAELLAGARDVLVLTDGTLALVPFGVLSGDSAIYRPLVQDRTVRRLPSLRLAIEKPSGPSAAGGFFALADPIYPETVAGPAMGIAQLDPETRSVLKRNLFAPLPETRTEVQAIAGLFAPGQSQLLLGADAVESRLKTLDLGSYRFVHFATHGLLGGEVPGVAEPSLVLGREAVEDGLLRMSEAEQLKLRAELTVLSACNTGAGALIAGEGVMGMSRAFLVAGSQSVLVSLWPVASKETEELMVAFYRERLAGKLPAQALRDVMLTMRARKPQPFYWAPFILVARR